MAPASDSFVLFFHGNGESVTNYCFEMGPGFLHHWHELGFHVVIVEYRGYHPVLASTGQQTLSNIGSDAALWIKYARSSLHAKRLMLYGRSIGSLAVLEAMRVCPINHVDAVIVESGFSTEGLLHRIRARVPTYDGPSLPLSETVAAISVPVAFFHAVDDHIVGATLNFSANATARGEREGDVLQLYNMGRHSVISWNEVAFWKSIEKFIAGLPN